MQPASNHLSDAGTVRRPSHRLPVNPRRSKVAPEKRRRVASACDACNIRRIRCSGDRPCRSCARSSRECIYPLPTEKIRMPLVELTELKRKVALYEQVLEDTFPDYHRRKELLDRYATAKADLSDSSASSEVNTEGSRPVLAHESSEGRMLQDPDGTDRYLGETSGATFLDYLKEFMRTVLPLVSQDEGSASGDGSQFLSSLGQYQTWDSRPLYDKAVDIRHFPPTWEMDHLFREFRYLAQDGNGDFASGGIYWWGVMGPPFGSAATSPVVTRTTDSQAHRHLAIDHTAFAVVSQTSTLNFPSLSQISHCSEAWFSRARLLIGNPLDTTHFGLKDVATLALMGFYLIEMNRRDAAYMYISNAMHISVMHGSHRGWVDEPQKRVFWTLYILDRYISCLMGRPPTIMDDAIRVPLPHDVPSMPPAAGLRAHAELSRISGHIVCNTYLVSPWRSSSGAITQLDISIKLLDGWRSKLPASLQLGAHGLSGDPTCCLLHMNYNQLLLLSIRPIFFKAIKKTFAERCVVGTSSLQAHPRFEYLRRCICASLHNIQLARHFIYLSHPRKLLQAGLHFIFNAAVVLILQELVHTEGEDVANGQVYSYFPHAHDTDIDFVLANFQEEADGGNNYGKDCVTVLRDLRFLVKKIKSKLDSCSRCALSVHPAVSSYNGKGMISGNTMADQEMTTTMTPSVQIGQEQTLYYQLLSWIENEWPCDGISI